MAMTTPTIAILGAGPSGLTLACILSIHKIPYVVFERDASGGATGQGGSLDIHAETGQLALKECGLFNEFQKLARYDGQAFKAVDKEGKVLADHQPGKDEYGRPEIDRTTLRGLLLKAVPDENIRWGRKVEAVEKEDCGTSVVKFTDGSAEGGFNLVVGADGAWSRIRCLRTAATPIYSGICYIQTKISPANPFYTKASQQAGRGTYFAATEGKAIISQRMDDGSYTVYAGVRLPENWAKDEAELFKSPGLREHLVQTEYASWSSEISDFLTFSDDGPLYCWQLYTLQPESLDWKAVPGVTLIGDAAHLALPNGAGVNCGMFDGMQLAREILRAGLGNLDKAIARYEEEMFPRAAEHIRDGLQMNDVLMAENSPRGCKEWLAAAGM